VGSTRSRLKWRVLVHSEPYFSKPGISVPTSNSGDSPSIPRGLLFVAFLLFFSVEINSSSVISITVLQIPGL